MKINVSITLATASLLSAVSCAPVASSTTTGSSAASTSSSDSRCKAYGQPGLMKLINYDTGMVNGTVLAEGTLSASTNEKGNNAISVQFDQCDFDFMGYSSGSSRNAGGSMGAPLEYFGHIRMASGQDCLTALVDDNDPEANASLRFQACQYDDTDQQQHQFFAYSINAGGHVDLGFVGKKNSTQELYQGPASWAPGAKPSRAFPHPIEVTHASQDYALRLVSQ